MTVSDDQWRLDPPPQLPPGRLVIVPQRGEFVVRDSGGEGPVVLLLHGWMFAADLNWWPSYRPLIEAGYRVIALDHRGHGRGLRTPAPFRLVDCADDAAAVLRTLGCEQAIAVGYSMGGPIAALTARRHPQLIGGVVFCATAAHWQKRSMKVAWRLAGLIRLVLGLFPLEVWRWALRRVGLPDSPRTTWLASELTRGSARDLAEAGRELGRYDGRPWLGQLTQPAGVVVTGRDRDVPPHMQRELAQLTGAAKYEVPGTHFAVSEISEQFNAALLDALRSVQGQAVAPDGARPDQSLAGSRAIAG